MKEKTINAIKEISNEVEETWLAADGGLTMAANDLLHFARGIIKQVENEDIESILKLDPFDTDTGDESKIIDIAQDWAVSTMDRAKFIELAQKWGVNNMEFILDSQIKVEFAGPIGNVIVRAYWNDKQGNRGCINIPHPEI